MHEQASRLLVVMLTGRGYLVPRAALCVLSILVLAALVNDIWGI